MSRYRPIKEGSQVQTLDEPPRPCIVREMHPDQGQVEVEFPDGERRRMSFGLIRRRKRSYKPRERKAPSPIPTVEFDNRIREEVELRMEKLGLTYETLSERSGLSRSSLWRILHDPDTEPRISSLESLAKALGISPREFWSPVRRVENPTP